MTQPQLDPATAQDLASLFIQLSQDPKTRKKIAQAIKEGASDSRHAKAFSDIEIEDKFEKFKQDQEDRELERQKSALLAEMNRKRNGLLTGGPDGEGRKYSEDDVKKIEALMEKKGISDYDDGATLYAATLPPIDPNHEYEPPQHGSTWEIPEFAKFGPDPVRASRESAHAIIGEFMRKR
jgi:spermidine/putrescine-binding protein